MPAPATVPELLDRLRKSGLVPADRLDGFLAGLNTHDGAPPAAVLDRLVDAGLITRFHADKLAAGKYKGFHLGSYLILDQLGQGGMGQVFLAEHAHMRRLVALKVFPVHALDDAVARERFFREARAAGTLDHPNIVRVFDLCQEGRILYLVMEYVEGVSLQALVAQAGPLPVPTACHYARQVAVGLQHAHERGFVHRDVKPANLLLDRTGVVKVLDLGLVRSEADKASLLTKQLDNKSILGTADYVAPEQALDSSRVDARADLYALGATLYFLLAGRPLFPDGRTAQKLVWQQLKDPVPLDRLRPEVPAELAAVVHHLLQKRPADRPPTASAVCDALAPFDPGDVPPPDPVWLPDPPPRVALARPQPVSRPAPASRARIATTARGSAVAARDPGSSQVGVAAGRRPAHHEPTASAGGDDTRPVYPPLPAPAPVPQPAGPTALLVALSVALVLSLLGIVLLLLRRP